jgi:hypothetical protein
MSYITRPGKEQGHGWRQHVEEAGKNLPATAAENPWIGVAGGTR